mgnify:CR=1 FL=1
MGKNIIEIHKLTKQYNNTKVLKSIDLEIEEWDFFALLWHNWAWKTTTINILTNLVNKSSWRVKIWWIDIDKDFSEARRLIWVVPQEFNFDQFAKVKDIPVNQAWYYWIDKDTAKQKTKELLKKLWLWEKRDSKARELSWWMKRRLMIVRALVHEPKILILDEPTAWVDVDLRKSMWEFIEKLNKNWTTILLTTHYLEEVEALCEKVAILDKGKIIENTSVKTLLSKLKEEVIILSVDWDIDKLDSSFKKRFKASIIDNSEIEVTITKKINLNELFKDLEKLKINIKSFRNKTNRLEALFMKIINK